MSQFTTNLTLSELSDRVEWLWLMRRDVATYLRDIALRGHLLQQSPEQILASLFQAMEELSADLRYCGCILHVWTGWGLRSGFLGLWPM